ncbi:transcriptional regulator [Vibrio ishigakensis]|uniref:Transcriptional regulator n=1 Tax=Vibrio ishigakensis TaxID=1481914 RepID=A0A0B8QGB1_9VIBR|nr:transcriptional regulator [Vibrio ishigakensis]GAM76112.1 transcriptional regulator [Vibrio ishigakensis]
MLITDILKHWDDTQSCYFRSLVSEEHKAEHRGDLAASIQLTARFHYELARLSKNAVLAELIQQLCLRSSLVIAAFGSKSSVNCECGSHSEIIDLLDAGELVEAQAWMAHHLELIKDSLNLDSKNEQPINFQQLFSEMEQ